MTTRSADQLHLLLSELVAEEGERLTVTGTLDLTPDGSGQPPVLRTLRQAGRTAADALGRHESEAVHEELRAMWEAADDASARGVLGFVWVSHPAVAGEDGATGAGRLRVMELATPIRTSIHAGRRPRLFEIARAAYLQRPVALVTADLHTMDVTRVQYGAATAQDQVDWPAHYLSKLGQRTSVDGRGGGAQADTGGAGHSYSNVDRSVEAHRQLFAHEAGEHLARFVQPDDILVVEGVDEARQQLLARLPEPMAERAIQAPAPPHGEDERARFVRLRVLAERSRLDEADLRAEEVLSGGDPNAVRGLEAIRAACVEGRVGAVIVHQDASEHFGTAEDARLHEPSVDAAAIEETLAAALRQGAEALFADDARLLDEEGMVAVARF